MKSRGVFRYVSVLSVLAAALAAPAFAQQAAGDKEIGLSGTAFVTHSSPVTGNVALQGSIGWYLSQNQFVGITAGPQFSFGGGSTTGSALYGGEYRYLWGSEKLWPFVGFQGLAQTQLSRSGGTTNTDTSGLVAPEIGLKYFASPRNSFEAVYQVPISVSGDGSFSQRSFSLVLLGFKHLF